MSATRGALDPNASAYAVVMQRVKNHLTPATYSSSGIMFFLGRWNMGWTDPIDRRTVFFVCRKYPKCRAVTTAQNPRGTASEESRAILSPEIGATCSTNGTGELLISPEQTARISPSTPRL